MEGLLFDTEFWSPTIAIAGLAILLAVALAAILFGYIADEEAKGRRIEWLEEPLALGGEPEKMQEAQLRKAA